MDNILLIHQLMIELCHIYFYVESYEMGSKLDFKYFTTQEFQDSRKLVSSNDIVLDGKSLTLMSV